MPTDCSGFLNHGTHGTRGLIELYDLVVIVVLNELKTTLERFGTTSSLAVEPLSVRRFPVRGSTSIKRGLWKSRRQNTRACAAGEPVRLASVRRTHLGSRPRRRSA